MEGHKSPVRDEGLPVYSEDVAVALPQPGHCLVVEVVDLTLEIGNTTHLGSEHEVCREQLQHLPPNWITKGINDGI